MIHEKKDLQPVEEEMTLADIVENEEDKKILEPVVKEVKKDNPFIIGIITADTAFMRKEPEDNATIITTLIKDDAVIVDPNGDVGDYALVTAKITMGYILKSQFKIK